MSPPEEDKQGQHLVDVGGAADYLGVSEAFVRRLVLEKRIRYYKVGKFVRIRTEDLDAFIEHGRVDPVEIRVRKAAPARLRKSHSRPFLGNLRS